MLIICRKSLFLVSFLVAVVIRALWLLSMPRIKVEAVQGPRGHLQSEHRTAVDPELKAKAISNGTATNFDDTTQHA